MFRQSPQCTAQAGVAPGEGPQMPSDALPLAPGWRGECRVEAAAVTAWLCGLLEGSTVVVPLVLEHALDRGELGVQLAVRLGLLSALRSRWGSGWSGEGGGGRR